MSRWDRGWRATILASIIIIPSSLILAFHWHY